MTAQPSVPAGAGLSELRAAVQGCRACELWRDTTQAVVGEGPVPARVMLVGEQPGDREDLEGEPFVGPAGRLLDRALQDAGLDRAELYLTNVVKHFRHRSRGKRRIHQRPDREHVVACRPWLDAELALVRPEILVCLGAVAAQGLLGPDLRVTRDRGKPLDSPLAPLVMVTIHPSAILRAGERRESEYDRFVADLRLIAAA